MRGKKHLCPLNFRETSIQCGNYSIFVNFCITSLIWYFPASSHYFPRLAFKITNLPRLRNYSLTELRRRHWVKNEESIQLRFEIKSIKLRYVSYTAAKASKLTSSMTQDSVFSLPKKKKIQVKVKEKKKPKQLMFSTHTKKTSSGNLTGK